jgi:hypothetical protein
MPVYDSTSAFLRQQFKNFANASQADKVLREAALYAAPAVSDRVQQDGKKSDGSELPPYDSSRVIGKGSPISRKFGEIASKKQVKARMKAFGDTDEFYGYADFRRSLGLQTAYMDLTLTGAMWGSWMPVPISNTAYGVAFTTAEQAKIAGYLEQRFGAIFELTNEELDQSLKIINRLAIQYLSK